ncbi:MAG TPA: DUF3761 domain-containing protein [Blastocatellia bacterium]|jgi:hypothetical protein|nr:DUF3761 domain-containing protein [Blastocatellia bacterium]
MWKKFYSNSGLILLAVLGAGVWTSNILAIYSRKSNDFADFNALTAKMPQGQTEGQALASPSPSPTPPMCPNPFGRPYYATPNPPHGYICVPPGSAICRDGSYSYSASRRAACTHHGGVAQWLSH